MGSTRRLLYYGYAVSEEWLLYEATKQGIRSEAPHVDITRMCGIILTEAGLFLKALPVRVSGSTADGAEPRTHWCFALASTDPRDSLPNPRRKGNPPVLTECYQLLKSNLGLDHEPCWYPCVL
ncbi:hypothetical protein PAXINDRAFT_169341 [Paxillus involutus ATCC 200175]|uniref:Uncharacterized protein n=1 Tax=Paxillus involutus ATCC 200175 TaxID=664439 RepID=A0A0C9U814_PAXIN|nr:hypothetical protein PAXINDRAFT_169341 [Paxillus involutus ATCC 200175]